MSYVDAALSTLQVKLQEVFPDSKRTKTILYESPDTANIMLQNQTAQVNNVTVGDRCTGFDVIYQTADSVVINSGSGSAPTANCTLTADRTFSGNKATYDINRWLKKIITLEAKDCNSVLKLADRMLDATETVMQEIALGLNQHFIASLVANNQTATHSGTLGLGINAGVVEYDKTQFYGQNWQQYIADWRQIAIKEKLPKRHIIANGDNFFIVNETAPANALNDDQRSQQAILGAKPMTWDSNGFDRAGISDTSFLIDPNAYVFYSRNWFTETVTMVQEADKATWRFSLPLTYLDANTMTKKTMMHKRNGAMVPIMIDVEMQYGCDATNTYDGFTTYNPIVKYQLTGGLAFAPNVGGSTGIVQINAI